MRIKKSYLKTSALALVLLSATALSESFGALPDFAAIKDVSTMKRAFYSHMVPIVEYQNDAILSHRETLLALRSEFDESGELGWLSKRSFAQLTEVYELDGGDLTTAELLTELELRIDIVPADIALVQAAKESGWGRSRFAVSYNNLFGQWCYKPGCGAVPKRRPEGERYEVAKFDDVSESVRRYMNNLNTHQRYANFRLLRAQRRAANQSLDGDVLAAGLLGYSQRGQIYVDEVSSMIRANKSLLAEVSAN
tara:strand:- start:131 stop:886 length:756 start_codon:yes stop_codon:yes gene_type:complete